MNFDEKVPHLLKREQLWFGSIISRPIDEDSKMNPISPSGQPMEVEAAVHIAPSPTMRPAQRIQIYNQQYWWRLLNTLHDVFPLVTRLFGYFDFNRTIGIPYLAKYPPRHWSLSLLGDRLVSWVEEEYHAVDKGLVLDAVKVDLAFNDSFIAAKLPPLTKECISHLIQKDELFSKPLYLQPHVYLFKMPYQMFRYRTDFLKQDPDYWLHNDFPALEKCEDIGQMFHFLVFRTAGNDILWKEISEGEYSLLERFKTGSSIDEACEWLETQGETLADEAMKNLQKWFEEWSMRGFLSLQIQTTESTRVHRE